MEDFIEKIAEALDIEDISVLSGSTKFRELDEWSSLGALSVISMFEDELNKDLSIPDFRKAQTIQDLYDLAQNKEE